MQHIRCSKCEIILGGIVEDYLPIPERYKTALCSECKRIEAWVPEIAAAVIKALRDA